ncbi:MAG: universal stress protein [bacterium]|nr:universal stress protein [bacterium]
MNKIEKILVGITGSEHSYYASLYAIYLASLLKAELIGIFVINEKSLDELLKANIFITEEKAGYEQDMENDALSYLTQFESTAMKKNIPVVKFIRKGVVHREIINFAEENHVDLVVIGELNKIISLKDIAYDEMERLLRESKIPVVVANNREMITMLYQNL